jgi:transcriptional regulator with PAS, ATPase and Fis domain
MQEIYELIAHTAATEANVIILGESGTGKELIAHTIHHLSNRQGQAFVPVNCGAIPDTLFESEFFGHRKGAFTGADRDQPGFFDRVHGGTLFLDEVGELSPTMQVKLLRVLESGEYIPVGDTHVRHTDVRIIAATNRDLNEQLRKGEIRKDFFYRINVVKIAVPPLRQRPEDIPLLIDHLLKKYTTGTVRQLPAKIIETLCTYNWPGNIRELQNVLQRYLTVGRLDFNEPAIASPAEENDILESEVDRPLYKALEAFEKHYLTRMLERHHWHKTKTAQALGIPRRTLHRKIKKLEIV